MSIQSYRDLVVWQKSMDLAVQCYQATKARHTQTSPSAQRGPMSNRDDQNYTGPSGY
jgi:hypothetical protein